MTKVLIIHKEGSGKNTLDFIKARMEDAGMECELRHKAQIDYDEPYDGYTHYIRWGCTTNFPRNSKGELAPTVINKSSGIHKAAKKADFRKNFLHETGSLYALDYYDKDNLPEPFDGYPIVVRPSQHAFSDKIAVADDAYELGKIAAEYGDDWYGAPWIDKDKEYRVLVVGGRIVYMDEKIPQDRRDVTWDRPGKECTLKNVKWGNWPRNVARAALEAIEYTGLDWGVVDVGVGDGEAYVFEVNTAPMLDYFDGKKETYNQRVMGEALIYLVENGPCGPVQWQHDMTWKDLIHPSRYGG